jgi:predicted DsbA family dithiol-disulfide isomerase
VQGGLGEEETKEWLASDKGGPEVDKEVASAKRRFISGVPNFTVNGKYEVQVSFRNS